MNAGRLSLRVCFDEAALALIARAGEASADAGLADLIAELCDEGRFYEALPVRVSGHILSVGLGPMTELLLREIVDVAEALRTAGFLPTPK